MTTYALIRRCDICGNVNAIDLDGTSEREIEIARAGHTVTRVTEAEAMELWRSAAECDHKKLIEELRVTIEGLKR